MVKKSRLTKIAHRVPNSTAAGTTKFQKYIYYACLVFRVCKKLFLISFIQKLVKSKKPVTNMFWNSYTL